MSIPSDTPANDNEGPFGLGRGTWPGLAKLAEECGEVVQIVAKLVATGGRVDHWSGLDLHDELCDELGDLLASITFVKRHNVLDMQRMADRQYRKLDLFEKWRG